MSSLRTFHGRHHDLGNWYGIALSQSLSHSSPFLIHDLSPIYTCNKSTTTDVTCDAVTAYTSGAVKCTYRSHRGLCCSIFIIPSPTKLRRDIVTLQSVLPLHPCEHSRINILQWILTKLGTYLVLKRIGNPIDFHGQRSKVKVTESIF